jgi:hypothetical protein
VQNSGNFPKILVGTFLESGGKMQEIQKPPIRIYENPEDFRKIFGNVQPYL